MRATYFAMLARSALQTGLSGPARSEQIRHFARRTGARKHVALCNIATALAQEFELIERLDAFSDDLLVERMRHVNDRRGERSGLYALGNFLHEAAIDLDRMHGLLAQISER